MEKEKQMSGLVKIKIQKENKKLSVIEQKVTSLELQKMYHTDKRRFRSLPFNVVGFYDSYATYDCFQQLFI